MSGYNGFMTLLNHKWYRLLKSRDYDDEEGVESSTPQPKPSGYFYKKKRKWKSLMDDYPMQMLRDKLLISMEWAKNRYFGVFDSLPYFVKYMVQLNIENRHFYEVILPFPQKPHFDIDMAKESDETEGKMRAPGGTLIDIKSKDFDPNVVKDAVVTGIISVLDSKGIKLDLNRDVLIYSSHGHKKWSYHIVINNYIHYDNEDAKGFYEEVIKVLPPFIKLWVDPGVYSSKQQFRVVGCQKEGSRRPKVFNEEWSYNGNIIKHFYDVSPEDANQRIQLQVDEGLVSNWRNCKFLPPFVDRERIRIKKQFCELENVTTEDARKAIKVMADFAKMTPGSRKFPFRFIGINGPIVLLKRIRPSNCVICDRIHQNENAFLIVAGDEKRVYYGCHRAPGSKKIALGEIGIPIRKRWGEVDISMIPELEGFNEPVNIDPEILALIEAADEENDTPTVIMENAELNVDEDWRKYLNPSTDISVVIPGSSPTFSPLSSPGSTSGFISPSAKRGVASLSPSYFTGSAPSSPLGSSPMASPRSMSTPVTPVSSSGSGIPNIHSQDHGSQFNRSQKRSFCWDKDKRKRNNKKTILDLRKSAYICGS